MILEFISPFICVDKIDEFWTESEKNIKSFDHPAEENVERREASGLHSFLPTLSLFSVSEAHIKDLLKWTL